MVNTLDMPNPNPNMQNISSMKAMQKRAATRTAAIAKSIQGKALMVFAFLLLAAPMTLFASGPNTSGFLDAVMGHLSTIVILIGGGLGIWGVINLIEGYGNDNPGANGQRGITKHKRNKRNEGLAVNGFA